MSVYTRVELELDGFLNGWTDISDDIRPEVGVYWDRGFPGDTVIDCVAKTGLASFALDNSTQNSEGALGLYTLDGPNVRAGFVPNVGVRISLVIDGDAYPQWTGRLKYAKAVAGEAGSKIVRCVAADYMDQCTRKSLTALEIQQDIGDSDLVEYLLEQMPIQPRATNIGVGFDTLPVVFHNQKAERGAASTEFQNIGQTTLSRFYIDRNGTFTYEPRSVRATNFTNSATITADDLPAGEDSLDVDDDRDSVINRVQAILHPPTFAPEEVVLFELEGVVQIEPNLPTPLRGLYTEPGLRARRAGGLDMLEPDPDEGDYVFNTEADGSGVDVTDQATVETDFTANSVLFTIEVPVRCYLITLKVRGIGVYDNANTLVEASDEDSIDLVGENTFSLDMKYSGNVAFGNEVVLYLLSLSAQNTKRARSAKFLLNGLSDARAAVLASLEISTRVGLNETLTALPLNERSGFFLNAIGGSQEPSGEVWLKWNLGPADATQYWYLEIPGFSELSVTTRLGFRFIVGHTDVEHSDDHTDSAHSDTAHGDSHGDTAHEDAGHGDAGHTDVTHSDTAHADSAHGDTAHVDGSNTISFDDSHADSAHRDTHGDESLHGDGHNDHEDGGHSDAHQDAILSHTDNHTDDAHGDGHVDIPHTDQHFDAAHSDSAHADTNHADIAHVDSDHTDAGHADVAHSDVAHDDSAHDDVEHGDDHDDIGHGDQN